MKYYSIGKSNEIDIIGFYPQTKRTSKSGFYIGDYNSERQVNPGEFPDFEPNFGLDINSEAKETDVLDSASCLSFGLIISKKLKLILEEYALPPHRFYPIKVYDSIEQYYWFHYISKIEKYIDFKSTTIEIYVNRPPFKIQEIKTFNSQEELMNFKREMSYKSSMKFKSICLTENFPKYDLFEITGAQYFTLISHKLMKRLKDEKITGFEYQEYDKIKTTPNIGYN
ncbi:hypothetical protein Q4599_03405 [Cellulophaga lytica]|uniref:imm11 family protein n=1 Tax=Cellulophaga lytica TaxID=979 RepID=UPI0026E11921|nr:hypothetical protein [Cellulophaga lytica]MDO6852609.1 hypothetical protein [Cellulophaga lytica]